MKSASSASDVHVSIRVGNSSRAISGATSTIQRTISAVRVWRERGRVRRSWRHVVRKEKNYLSVLGHAVLAAIALFAAYVVMDIISQPMVHYTEDGDVAYVTELRVSRSKILSLERIETPKVIPVGWHRWPIPAQNVE